MHRQKAPLYYLILLFFLSLGFGLTSWAESSSPTLETRNSLFVFRFQEKETTYMKKIMGQSVDLFQKITKDIGFKPIIPVVVIMASTQKAFNQFQPPNHPLPSWAIGVAYPSRNLMVIRSPRLLKGVQENTLTTFTHELTHLILAAGFKKQPIPRWLNEGMAMYASYEWRPSQDMVMGRAVLSGNLIPLDELTQAFGGKQHRVQLAYYQSYSLIHYLISNYGNQQFQELIRLLSLGQSFEDALQDSLLISSQTLEAEWKRYLKFRFNWIPLLTSTGVLWAFISLSLIGVYFVRKRRTKRILERWALEEAWEELMGKAPRSD